MILPPATCPIQLYGIGHAMVDLYAVLLPCSVLPFVIKAGKAVHLDEGAMGALVGDVQALCRDDQSKTALFCKTAGGTVANILRTAARLGATCIFSGSTGTDVAGKRDTDAHFFQKECAKAKVQAHLVSNTGTTGRCLAVYTGQSTIKAIAASPSAARCIKTEQVLENEIIKANSVIIEGMLFLNEAVSRRVLELCKKHDKLLTVDVASRFVAETVVTSLTFAVKNKLIVAKQILIFANEHEYAVIKKKAQSDRDYLVQHGAILIEKRAEKGARLYWHGDVFKEVAPVQSVVDDTGAGDAFAGGFLLCFLAQYATEQWGKAEVHITEDVLRACLKAGNESAVAVLANYGCTVST